MDKREFRAIIIHLATQGKSPKENHRELVELHSHNAPSYSMIKNWCKERRLGRTNLEDRSRSGRPPEAITEHKLASARSIVTSEPKISAKRLAEELKLDDKTAKKLMEEHLGLVKLNARWVPHQLSELQLKARVNHATDLLARWGDRWSRFRSRLVTMDETWITYVAPETRQSAGEWRPRRAEPPEVPRLATDRRKSIAVVFWDSQGLVHLEWFIPSASRRGLNSGLYEAILDRFHESLKERRPEKLARGVLLLQDNAPCHTTTRVAQKLAKLRIELVQHPPYSPDLAPSDYYLFRDLKQSRRGRSNRSQEDLDREIQAYFSAKPADFYKKGIELL